MPSKFGEATLTQKLLRVCYMVHLPHMSNLVLRLSPVQSKARRLYAQAQNTDLSLGPQCPVATRVLMEEDWVMQRLFHYYKLSASHVGAVLGAVHAQWPVPARVRRGVLDAEASPVRDCYVGSTPAHVESGFEPLWWVAVDGG